MKNLNHTETTQTGNYGEQYYLEYYNVQIYVLRMC